MNHIKYVKEWLCKFRFCLSWFRHSIWIFPILKAFFCCLSPFDWIFYQLNMIFVRITGDYFSSTQINTQKVFTSLHTCMIKMIQNLFYITSCPFLGEFWRILQGIYTCLLLRSIWGQKFTRETKWKDWNFNIFYLYDSCCIAILFSWKMARIGWSVPVKWLATLILWLRCVCQNSREYIRTNDFFNGFIKLFGNFKRI